MATMRQKINEYSKEYGFIPTDYDERMHFLLSILKFKEKDVAFIKAMHKKLASVKTEKIYFTLYLVPEPTPRPRTTFNSHRFYVKGARDNNELFAEILSTINSIPLITTATQITVTNYLPTPKGMNRFEKFFSELGLVRVLTTPDWDNLAKAYCDMIQKNLLLNDSLIWKGTSVKYYSIKPRIELVIEYDKVYDCTFNRKRIESSKFYLSEEKTRFDNALKTVLKLK
jgi:Holliday junction resolvase RusA-like endonuclease